MHTSQILQSVTIMLFTLSFATTVQASESSGTIDDSFKFTRVCQDEVCGTFGDVNWKPTLNADTTGATVVSITDSGLTGYAWGTEIGWINLSPTGAGVEIDPNTGVLSGAAYSSVGGWINFAPTGEGVSINSDGEFDGFAFVSGVYGGWMKFDCATAATCIKTDWRPIPARGAGGGSSGGGGVEEGGGRSGGGGGGGGGGTRVDRDRAVVVATSTTTPATTTPAITTLTTTTPAYVFTQFLTIGARGAEVSAMQRVLTDLGYYTFGRITGYFGPITREAVIALQKAENIPPFSGYVDHGTRAALNRHSMPVIQLIVPTTLPTSTSTSTSTATSTSTSTATSTYYSFVSAVLGILNDLITNLVQLLKR